MARCPRNGPRRRYMRCAICNNSFLSFRSGQKWHHRFARVRPRRSETPCTSGAMLLYGRVRALAEVSRTIHVGLLHVHFSGAFLRSEVACAVLKRHRLFAGLMGFSRQVRRPPATSVQRPCPAFPCFCRYTPMKRRTLTPLKKLSAHFNGKLGKYGQVHYCSIP